MPRVMAPEVAVLASRASSKMMIKSLVFAAMVVPLVGKTPTTVGAEVSALPPVVNLEVNVAGSGILFELCTLVLITKL